MVALVVGRAFQGVAGGGLMQLVNITLSDIFSMRYVFLGRVEIWKGEGRCCCALDTARGLDSGFGIKN
jgi:hypothetical protein